MSFIKKEYLPSKKFITSLCIAIFLVIVAIAFNYSKPNTTIVENNLVIDASSSLADLNPEWLKQLQETDPAKIEESKKEIEEYQNLPSITKLSRNLISNIIASRSVGLVAFATLSLTIFCSVRFFSTDWSFARRRSSVVRSS